MQAQLEPLGGALQLTELRNLLDVVLEQAVSGLRELAAQLPSKTDDARSAARCAAILSIACNTPAVLPTLRPRSRLLASLLSRACHADIGIIHWYLGAHQLRAHSGVQNDRLYVTSCEAPIRDAKRLAEQLSASCDASCLMRTQEAGAAGVSARHPAAAAAAARAGAVGQHGARGGGGVARAGCGGPAGDRRPRCSRPAGHVARPHHRSAGGEPWKSVA